LLLLFIFVGDIILLIFILRGDITPTPVKFLLAMLLAILTLLAICVLSLLIFGFGWLLPNPGR